ncbi:MAG: hypothetical protein ACHQHK_02120 [Dongiales bacterium]
MLRQIALVSTTRDAPLPEVAQTAAALQTQVSRDLGQFWGAQACVSAFGSLSDIPIGYWPIVVSDTMPEPGAAGMHLDRHGNPYCLVECGPTWSLAASHECLEMLVDPTGNWQIWGSSPLPEQSEVGYLVEICDPCQDAQFGYAIDGVLVSDFCTPSFFEPEDDAGARYSFTGAVERPLAALRNGYLSWFDPLSRGWYQQRFFGSQPKFSSLGLPGSAHRCLREFTGRAEADHRRLSHFSAAATERVRQRLRRHAEESTAAAELLQEEIGTLGRRMAPLAFNQRR